LRVLSVRGVFNTVLTEVKSGTEMPEPGAARGRRRLEGQASIQGHRPRCRVGVRKRAAGIQGFSLGRGHECNWQRERSLASTAAITSKTSGRCAGALRRRLQTLVSLVPIRPVTFDVAVVETERHRDFAGRSAVPTNGVQHATCSFGAVFRCRVWSRLGCRLWRHTRRLRLRPPRPCRLCASRMARRVGRSGTPQEGTE
jgi:hypothetical protein